MTDAEGSTVRHRHKLYHEVADSIRQKILDGAFATNQALPSETEIATQYGVSRITVRQAIARLAEENLVKRLQGKGTFVQEMNFEQNMLGSDALLNENDAAVHMQSFKIFDYDLILPPKHFNTIFKLLPGARVHSFRRLKFRDNQPVMLERLLIPESLAPDLSQKGIDQKWIAGVLKEEYGFRLARMRKTLQPIVIGPAEARHLKVPPRSLGLLVDRTTWRDDHDSLPIMVTRSIVRSEHAKLYADMSYDHPQ